MAHAIRNFNLVNRAEWEISRMKLSPAPRHPSTVNLLLKQMSKDKLLSLLKDVYDAGTRQKPKEFRFLKEHQFDMMNVKNIPKGKISIVRCIDAAQIPYRTQDVNSLLKYFVSFEVKIFPP
ncbi:hypothetical protein FD755_024374 [Muntiacus reevesi]|uniref:NADH dehydrogenase [ubiquinone] 1 alpha subcomplex assembly factor 4 n=1 Tax=Muntiacus reevesi TaxID=9886 RepID=A0A5N3V9V7_MUNRE|nr:hypothetical protein FD755_024374 [Muntiacus reevesi]